MGQTCPQGYIPGRDAGSIRCRGIDTITVKLLFDVAYRVSAGELRIAQTEDVGSSPFSNSVDGRHCLPRARPLLDILE